MKALVFSLLLLGLAHTLLASSDTEVAAHKSAMDLAGAFANDGFKIRDGLWMGNIGGEAKKVRVIQVNLFAGNQYWFCFGSAPGVKASLELFDETGKAMETDAFAGEGNSAVGFSPVVSGPYYVRIQEVEGEPADCCLLYCYK